MHMRGVVLCSLSLLRDKINDVLNGVTGKIEYCQVRYISRRTQALISLKPTICKSKAKFGLDTVEV